MTLKEFAVTTQAKVAAKLNQKTELKEVLKLNGIRRYGLIIHDPVINVSPTVYLEPFYERFSETADWHCIIDDIVRFYQDNRPDKPMDTSSIFDFSLVKEKIFYRLINYETNRELLEQMPHTRFLDLAKVFCIRYERDDISDGTIPVYHSHLERWGINADELNAIADANSPRFMRPHISDMNAVLAGAGLSQEDLSTVIPDGFPPMYVMTNISKSNGAGTICYPDTLNSLSEKTNQDIVILPCSIHEVILIPVDEDKDMEALRDVVHSVNTDVLSTEEFLSDNVYIYRRNTGQIEIA